MRYEYAGYSGPTELDATTYFGWTEAFSVALNEEFQQYGGTRWEGAAGGCNFVARISDDKTGETRLLKVPKGLAFTQLLGRAERAALKFLETIEPECPFTIPRLLREQDDPQSFVVTEVPGDVLTHNDTLTDDERYLLGRDVGRFALWEKGIDTTVFERTLPLHQGWDWMKRFSTLDSFDDPQYPTTMAVVEEMRALRGTYCTPDALSAGRQVTHSDLRLPNLVFTGVQGSRRLHGVFDWGTVQIGNDAQEARGLYAVGESAIAGYNDELVANAQLPIDANGARFWYVGRRILGLVHQLQSGVPSADDYASNRDALIAEYPDRDWREFSTIDAQVYEIHHESGGSFGPMFV